MGCRCGATWGGGSQAHCAACHRTFSTVGNFDRHRLTRNDGERICVDPGKRGLVPGGRATTVWMQPGRDAS